MDSEKIFYSLVSAALVIDGDMRIKMVNPSASRMFGYEEKEILGHSVQDLAASDWGGKLIRDLVPAGKSSRSKQVCRHRSGRQFPVLLTVSSLDDFSGDEAGMVLVFDDISDVYPVDADRPVREDSSAAVGVPSEEQWAELLLRQLRLEGLLQVVAVGKKEWETTMDCIGAMLLLVDEKGEVSRCNRAVQEFVGIPFVDIIGRNWHDIFSISGLAVPENSGQDLEIYHEDSGRWFHFRAYPLSFDDTGAAGQVMILHDTTELKNISEELAVSNREIELRRTKLQEALDRLSSLIQQVANDKDFDVQFVNPALEKCWEAKQCDKRDCPCYGQDAVRCWQVAGTFCGGVVQGKFAAKIGNCMQCQVYKEATRDPIYQIGEQFNNMMHILKTKNRELEKAYDILKTTQVQLLQQEKMASIGQLAAGVAHEINNPIGFVSSNLGTMAKYMARLKEFCDFLSGVISEGVDQEVKEKVHALRSRLKFDFLMGDIEDLIRESLEGTDRVGEIVRNLKVFSRVDQAEHKVADINECIDSTINIIWSELKYKVTLHREYGSLPPTYCYPQQLNQVFMNILVNASQSIEKTGEIWIKTWAESHRIHVRITDTGAGIAKEKISRIFEPFFTTKEVGKGTGLGLSIAFDIIVRHGGEILVKSEVGRGTTFEVIIPVREDPYDG